MADSGFQACCCSLSFIVFGAVLLYSGTQRFLLRQRIMNTPTSKVRSAAVGLVELFGKADFEGDMLSPISKTMCAYWRITGEWYKSGKHGGWRKMFASESSEPFHLVDETGRMLVEPKGAEVSIPHDLQSTGHLSDKGFLGLPRKKLDGRVLAFIESDQNTRARFAQYSHRNLRVTEYFIAEGDQLYVLGNAQPREGASSAVAHENLVIRKGTGSEPMFISDSGEKSISGKMFWDMALWLGVGTALSGIGVVLLIVSLS